MQIFAGNQIIVAKLKANKACHLKIGQAVKTFDVIIKRDSCRDALGERLGENLKPESDLNKRALPDVRCNHFTTNLLIKQRQNTQQYFKLLF